MTFSRKNEGTGEDNISDPTPTAKADRYMYRAWLCEILEHMGLPLRNCSTFLKGVICVFIFCLFFVFFWRKKTKNIILKKTEINFQRSRAIEHNHDNIGKEMDGTRPLTLKNVA